MTSDQFFEFIKKVKPFTSRKESDTQYLKLACQPCLVCGEKPDAMGVFVPNNHQDFGAAENKERVVFYSICKNDLSRLQAEPEGGPTMSFIETKIKREVESGIKAYNA